MIIDRCRVPRFTKTMKENHVIAAYFLNIGQGCWHGVVWLFSSASRLNRRNLEIDSTPWSHIMPSFIYLKFLGWGAAHA